MYKTKDVDGSHTSAPNVNTVEPGVEPSYFELGYFEQLAVSNSNRFPPSVFISHLLSAISNPCYFELFFVSLECSTVSILALVTNRGLENVSS